MDVDADLERLFAERRTLIAECMRQGGFLKGIESRPGLERVRRFFAAFCGEIEPETTVPGVVPQFFPPFPGLRHMPFHDDVLRPAVATLQASAAALRQELQDDASYIVYDATITDRGQWSALPLSYMGVRLPEFGRLLPTAEVLLDTLDDLAIDYPWGDALLSRHQPGTHLQAHASVDNLRLRAHLGIQVPPKARIRVGDQERCWADGEVLLFEDSFEHEVWNDGDGDRVILIVDFWHPDLSAEERAALLAGFRKAEVRAHLFDIRTSGLEPSLRVPIETRLLEAFRAQDQAQAVRDYWG